MNQATIHGEDFQGSNAHAGHHTKLACGWIGMDEKDVIALRNIAGAIAARAVTRTISASSVTRPLDTFTELIHHPYAALTFIAREHTRTVIDACFPK